MAACVAVRERLWTEFPMKVELAPSTSPWTTRFRSRTELGVPELVETPCSTQMSNDCVWAPSDAEVERIRSRLRTESSFGMPISPYRSCVDAIKEDMIEPRNRFRTGSSFGMPISPWFPMGVAANVRIPEVAPSLPLTSMTPFSIPGSFSVMGTPLSVEQQMDSYMLGAASSRPVVPQAHNIQLSSLIEGAAPHIPMQTTGSGLNTTVMIRNLPVGLSRSILMDLMDTQGFAGRYDFAYLPVHFDTLIGLSHAFVNMVTPADAERLREHMEGFTNWPVPSDAVCHVVWNDKHQGLAALAERYRNSPVMHESVPDECKPAIIINGRRVAFPPPTQKVKAPRIGKARQ